MAPQKASTHTPTSHAASKDKKIATGDMDSADHRLQNPNIVLQSVEEEY